MTDQTDREALAPCPACTSELGPFLTTRNLGRPQVMCSTCGTCGPMERPPIEGVFAGETAEAAWGRLAAGYRPAPEITEAMVERAARALYADDEDAANRTEHEFGVDLGPSYTWDEHEAKWPDTADAFRRRARAALTAALSSRAQPAQGEPASYLAAKYGPCEACGGEGRRYSGHPNDPHPRDAGECQACQGTGMADPGDILRDEINQLSDQLADAQAAIADAERRGWLAGRDAALSQLLPMIPVGAESDARRVIAALTPPDMQRGLAGDMGELISAAQDVLDETDKILAIDPPPIKFRAPYGTLARLRGVLNRLSSGSGLQEGGGDE